MNKNTVAVDDNRVDALVWEDGYDHEPDISDLWCHDDVNGLSLSARGLWVMMVSYSIDREQESGDRRFPLRMLQSVGGSEDALGELVSKRFARIHGQHAHIARFST